MAVALPVPDRTTVAKTTTAKTAIDMTTIDGQTFPLPTTLMTS